MTKSKKKYGSHESGDETSEHDSAQDVINSAYNAPISAGADIAKLVDMLISLLDGKPVSESHIVNLLPKEQAERQRSLAKLGESSSTKVISEGDRNRLTKQLFRSIQEQSVPFKEIAREEGKIVYADPSAPEDTSKQITYLWNSQVNKLQILPGENADAIIPNDKDGQLIEVKSGKTIIHGNQEEISFCTQNAPTDIVSSIVLSTQDSVRSGIADVLKLPDLEGNMLLAFEITAANKESLKKLSTQFTTQKCDKARGTLMNQMEQSYRYNQLDPLSFSSPYDADGFRYFWHEIDNTPIGVRVDAAKNIQLVLPEGYKGKEIGLMLWKGWLEGNMSDGRPHPDTGFSGGSIIFIDSSGNATQYDSAKHPNSEKLVPDNPAIVGTVKFSEAEIALHIERAREAARLYVLSHGVSAQDRKTPTQELAASEVAISKQNITIQNGENPMRSAVSKILDDAIPKVKTLSGVDFDLRCAFDEETCQYEENGDYHTYPAKVFVYTYPGTGLKEMRGGNFSLPQGIIVEVSRDGEARIRAAYTPGGAESTAIAANISFMGKVANVTNIGADTPSVILPKDSKFRDNGERGMFMCVKGCCGHYTPENQNLMRSSPIAKQLA